MVNYKSVCLIIIIVLTGCSALNTSSSNAQSVIVEREYPKYPEGTVEYVWEEPARDVVDVPPGLDPEGQYYRPGHQEVVESLPGRYKFYTRE
jgi:uncharacterized protein YceK